MVFIDGVKYACETCIRGHRVTTCTHKDRPLTMIKPKGRPVSQCVHCRAARKNNAMHTKCDCSESKKQSRDKASACSCGHGGKCDCSKLKNAGRAAAAASRKFKTGLHIPSVHGHSPYTVSASSESPSPNSSVSSLLPGAPVDAQRHDRQYNAFDAVDSAKSVPLQFVPVLDVATRGSSGSISTTTSLQSALSAGYDSESTTYSSFDEQASFPVNSYSTAEEPAVPGFFEDLELGSYDFTSGPASFPMPTSNQFFAPDELCMPGSLPAMLPIIDYYGVAPDFDGQQPYLKQSISSKY